MVFPVYAHFQSPKISVQISTHRSETARKRQKPQTLTPTLANSQATHQALKSPTLLLTIDIFTLFYVTSKIEIKPLRRQFLGD
jgi:hypothetical protein